MQIKDVLHASLGRSKMVTDMLLADFTDAEIMVRPVTGASPTAWQLGHLVTSLNHFGMAISPGSMPPLPAGFVERHSKETAGIDDATAFLSKTEYLRLLDCAATALVDVLGLPERVCQRCAGRDEEYAPQISDVLALAAEHEMMHSGHFSVVRRRLGKPVVF